jgi:putative ABC transport system permease protein
MFKHLFKLIWNKKKQNSLLLLEMLISFLVMFAVFTMMVYYSTNYKKPMGMEHANVWTINYNNPLKTTSGDSLNKFYEALKLTLKSLPQVKELSLTSVNTPFSTNTMQTGLNFNGRQLRSINQYEVETAYKDVLTVTLLEGRWFSKEDITAINRPIVINKTLKDELFGKEPAAGKVFGDAEGKNKTKVIGVVEDIKVNGDYAIAGKAMYKLMDTASLQWINKMLIRVAPGADAAFESKLYKAMANSMKNSNVEIEHLASKRKTINNFSLIPMIVMLIIAGFLVINVALGLFGVLWYNINKRRGEIGLRRAVGASGKSVSVQLVAEALILTTLSVIIGSFFAIQFPLLNVFDLPAGIYLKALFGAIVFIYALVMLCAFYPGKQAAAIYPAVALHEE